MSCSRNQNRSGRNMHSRMKLRQYELRIHPSNWHRSNMVSNFVDRMQGIQQHACHSAHACNPTHSTNSPRRRQESSTTGVEHVLRQVDAHDHQNTLEDQHRHMHQCAFGLATPKKTICMLENKLDEGAELMHWLQQNQEFASTRCHHEVHAHHHGQPSLVSTHQLRHHKQVKELVSPQWTECQWCLARLAQAMLSHMSTCKL